MILVESRSGVIYHSCSINDLYHILKSNKLESRHHNRTCLTRSLKFAKEFLNTHHHKDNPVLTRCVLVLDLYKLSSRYKLVPASDYYNIIQSYKDNDTDWTTNKSLKSRFSSSNNKSEEYIDKPVTNISKYIMKVMIDKEVENYTDNKDISNIVNMIDPSIKIVLF